MSNSETREIHGCEVLSLPLSALTERDLILTPNRRLSAWLKHDHDQLMLKRDQQAWAALRAEPMDQWLAGIWQWGCDHAADDAPWPELLGDAQSHARWRQLLADEPAAALDPEGLVQAAQQARVLVERWCLSAADWQAALTPEQELFARTHTEYLDWLRTSGHVDSAGVGNACIAQLQQQPIALVNGLVAADRVWLHGFNDLEEPRLQAFISTLQCAGVSVRFSHRCVEQVTEAQAVSCGQRQQQASAALHWALAGVAAGRWQRVALVVPDLQAQRAQWQRLCADLAHAQPQWFDGEWQATINITAGHALADYPLVAHSLLLLRGIQRELSLAQWSVLLRSPFFNGGVQQLLWRDAFIRLLTRRNIHQCSLRVLQRHWAHFCDSQKTQAPLPPLWPELTGVGRHGEQAPGYWAEWIVQQWQQAGWQRERVLNSVEYQVHERLLTVLHNLYQLDALAVSLSLSEVLTEFERQARVDMFQPQTALAPIQVMGVLEAAGNRFDALWLLDGDSDHWPEVSRPNPLLSRALLQRHQMPGSGSERELSYARSLLALLLRSAATIRVSWGEYDADNELRASPLLWEVPIWGDAGWGDSGWDRAGEEMAVIPALTPAQPSLELQQRVALSHQVAAWIPDTTGTAREPGPVRGGSGVIQAQAVCPFQAYARYRLEVRPEETLQEGVPAHERGNLLHQVLELLWQGLQDHARLVSDPAAARDQLRHALDAALAQWAPQTEIKPNALRTLERDRTEQLLQCWLDDCEQQRAAFVVEQREEKLKVALAGLVLELTLDRLDRLADGSYLVIDYKSGKKNHKALVGERPEEPQLALYALALRQRDQHTHLAPLPVRAIAIANLRSKRKERQWAGWCADVSLLSVDPKTRKQFKEPDSNWEEEVSAWEQHLTQLASEFQRGDARVDVLKESHCGLCGLQALCRVQAAGAPVAGDDDATE